MGNPHSGGGGGGGQQTGFLKGIIHGGGMSLGQRLFGKTGDDDKDMTPAVVGSGWTGERRGHTEAPPPLEPLYENPGPQPRRSRRSRFNQSLGSFSGRIATDVAGNFLSDYRQRRNTKKQFEYLEGKGLTPWEIAGGGGGGSAVSSQGNTLGSGPGQQQSSQQEFQREQARLERANRLQVAQITAGPGREQAEIGRGRLALERLINAKQLKQFDENLKQVQATVRRMNFDLDNFWSVKFAGMGPENGMLALVAAMGDLDFEMVLNAVGDIPDEEKAKMWRVYQQLRQDKSHIGLEAGGAFTLLRNFFLGTTVKTSEVTQTLGPIDPKSRRTRKVGRDDPWNLRPEPAGPRRLFK